MYSAILRDDLRREFPEEMFFFQAANITNQILNFGLPVPIDIQIVGRNAKANYQHGARRSATKSPRFPARWTSSYARK